MGLILLAAAPDFTFLGSKITADGDYSHEIKRHLLLRRKGMTNLDSILKNRDITLPTKALLVKAMVFPVVTYGCESWTVKRAEHRRIDAFELRCWRRLLRVPWTAKRSNQSILKEISPGCFLEGMMLKMTLQYFGHLMQRVDSLEKTLMLWGIEGRRRRERQRMRWLDGYWLTDSMDVSLSELTDSVTRWTWVWVNSGSWWWTGRPGVPRFMGSQRVGHDQETELNWTELRAFLRWCFLTCIHFFTIQLHFHFSLSCIGEGNGNSLQCSCLENPRDGGDWWAAVSGVTQSRTGLKWCRSSMYSTKVPYYR